MADSQTTIDDPHIWLEVIDGLKQLAWVKDKNRLTKTQFTGVEHFDSDVQRLKAILDSDDRIPMIQKIGDYYYNFWQDAQNPKGLWRRTTLEQYRKENTQWETVLDIDELSEDEGENWVYKGALTARDHNRSLVDLSRGGGDATVIREFDLVKLGFVKDGFFIPEAKSNAVWLSKDEILVATDFGKGSLTDSGYPRIVKLLRRGQDLTDAETIFEGEQSDVSVSPYSNLTPGYETHGVVRSTDFYNDEVYKRESNGDLTRLDKPSDGYLTTHRDWLFIQTKTAWEVDGNTYPGNSLLVIDREAYSDGNRNFEILFQASQDTFLNGFDTTKDHVLVDLLRDVQDEVHVFSKSEQGWTSVRVDNTDGFQSASVFAVDRREDANRYWSLTTDFLTPATLSIGTIGGEIEFLKQSPQTFDASPFEVKQHWVRSADGTKVPYFLIKPKEETDPIPTLLYGYGGFEISMLPSYLSLSGPAWLARGGAYVIANIRGGGEFGPEWHLAALKENRPRAYEDFIAVAEDLIERKVTTASQLGAMGGSNGGLLMGNMLTRKPELFGALVIAVPLIDMKRYSKLLAGASWIAEYGDPDIPEEWEFIRGFSPYHNLKSDIDYPQILITTSTKDDRVHPGHARKLAAKLDELGHTDVWYYENTEGGHAGAADNSQLAFVNTLEYEFLWQALTSD